MLSTISVARRPGLFCFLTNEADLIPEAEAPIREDEGLTVVVRLEAARANGIEPDFVAAWLTLEVHSALEAVGLTAAVSRALADEGIACNMFAGYHLDHLLVPADAADSAARAIQALASVSA